MSDNQQNINLDNTSDEITLKELAQKIKEYALEVKKNWLIVAAFISVSIAVMLYKYYTTPNQYTATLTFMVNEKEGGGGMAGASSILASLGGAAGDKFNLEKILTLSKSMRIIQEVLFLKEKFNGKEDYLANHIISQYDFDNTIWKKNNSLKGFRFSKSKYTFDIDSLNTNERIVLKLLHGKVGGSGGVEGLLVNNHSRITQIMTMSVTTTSDELSVLLCQKIFDRLGHFYVEKTIEREMQTFRLVKMKSDSIKRLLTGADYAAARFEDTNRGLLMEQVKVPIKQLNRNNTILSTMYAESIRNLEMTDFAVKSNTPFVQAIDIPFSPLLPDNSNSFRGKLISAIAFGFAISIFFLVVKKLIKDLLA